MDSINGNNVIIISSNESKDQNNYYRKTSPEMTHKLWTIIKECDFESNENTLIESLINKMIHIFDIELSEHRIKQLISNAIEDKLIVLEFDNRFGLRYKPNSNRSEFDDLTNDWFCFECHSCYEQLLVFNCNHCFRSFHKNCIKDEIKISQIFLCDYCLKQQNINESLRINCIEKSRLNHLLKLLINNLDQSDENSDISKTFSIEINERSKMLIFKSFDLKSILLNVGNEVYESLEQFENHFKHFVHNYMVSVLSAEELGQKCYKYFEFKKRFDHEIQELKLCIDCYQRSSDDSLRDNSHKWFTEVCEPPHELVMAKMSPYPYWPSKVIQIKNDGHIYDVRFFDPPIFSRLEVHKKNLRSIEHKQHYRKELIEPLKLLESHKQKLKEKGIEFKRTVFDP